ncbi:hypothetical protein S40288_00867 [Stachybotrys chartarum IBT 40288]|nr:hypothetical protein S40288_00867 [Stachybotrys chartarum IBT 40288]
MFGVSVVGAAGLALFAFVAYFLIKGIYNVYFHPLNTIPGPKLYAFTDFLYLYHLVRGEWPLVLRTFHEQYGEVVRYAPGGVSFITVDGWKDIYGHKNDASRNYAKCPKTVPSGPSGHSNIIKCNDDDHKRMRRLLSHAFSEKALRSQEDIMKHYIDIFINKLDQKERDGEVIDIVKWFNYLTFDLIGDLAFGQPFGCLEGGGYHPWVAMIFSSVRVMTLGQVIRKYPLLTPLAILFIPPRLIRNFRENWRLSEATVKRRLEAGATERADFMSYILRHNDDKGMSTGEIVENANIIIMAGSETTASQLSGMTFNLLTNPKALDKLVKEIRGTFKSEEEITLIGVNELEYMPAIINESFRIYPPVPIGLTRLVPKGGDRLAGYWLPEGTSVSVPQWSAYRSENHWLEADKFIPERWLGDARFDNDNKGILNPFSHGPRNCIGKNLAYAEMRLILARFLWRYDVELMPESRNWNQQKIYTIWAKGELKVKLKLAQRGSSG